MISEPELVRGDGDAPIPPPHGTPPYGGPAPVESPADPDGEQRSSPRPWLWAVGGALVASALWAGGLYAYQAMGPDLGGYRASEDLCEEAKLSALSAAYGERGEGTLDVQQSHEALDQAQCSVAFGTDESPYSADFSYVLHKKTDPGPEFEPAETAGAWDQWKWEPVAGLGERAFFAQDDQGFAGLKVLDGQAVLTLFLSAQVDYDVESRDAPKPPDEAALAGMKDHMVEDMRTLMVELRR
ncbi:hypothetical protein [Streptomyces gobitricini]|uniref:DUF3558 domain-containing protein n=1 Tax=Streptomyces gobitricini TaxID=68211 RepID=A0ABN3LA74_9ACTN